MVAIDGLDKSISSSDSFWRTIASLIKVADHIRIKSALKRATSHVLVLCRNDVFSKIHLPDGNKIRSDAAIQLDWLAAEQDPDKVLLWDYLETKTETPLQDLFSHLPEKVQIGSYKRDVKRWLLDLTRYTPRDLAAFFIESSTPK